MVIRVALSWCAPNMRKFIPQFDHVVLLTARIATLELDTNAELNDTVNRLLSLVTE